MTSVDESTWVEVCGVNALPAGQGAAVLLPDGAQVAVFRTATDQYYALSNVDPFSGASVLARGIVGDVDGVPMIASPIYKQHFDLRTGRCIEDESIAVQAFPVRVLAGRIAVGRS